MVTRISSQKTHEWLKDYFRQRHDIGLKNWLASFALCPPNRVDTGNRRVPRHGFLFGLSLFAFTAGWFLYFSL